MSDYYEVDFLDVESKKSGDAITVRYQINGITYIHVVDGGFQSTGEKVVKHIHKYYNNPSFIDAVVVTHNDGDHAGGLRTVLETFDVGALYMLRPWLYADEIIDRFSRFTSVENLKKRLREIYPNLVALEDIAIERDIPIFAPFQGADIGAFRVLSPSKERYLDLLVESDKTPESVEDSTKSLFESISNVVGDAVSKVINLLKAEWGKEVFSSEETSAENEMSVVQYANLCNKKIVLTGDTGRAGMLEAANYAPYVGLELPGVDTFQVPHHGSRRNVSTEVLDMWLGKILPSKSDRPKFNACISSALMDKDHPRKSVERAMIHRGAVVYKTEGKNLRIPGGKAPERNGWTAALPAEYPEEQEE